MEVCLECEETFDNSVEEEEALDHGGGIVESSSKTIQQEYNIPSKTLEIMLNPFVPLHAYFKRGQQDHDTI